MATSSFNNNYNNVKQKFSAFTAEYDNEKFIYLKPSVSSHKSEDAAEYKVKYKLQSLKAEYDDEKYILLKPSFNTGQAIVTTGGTTTVTQETPAETSPTIIWIG